jgi:cyclopropane fatty-acyl-phospholipid synthase-like methyltransferase
MSLNHKTDCIESIVRTLERTSAWRKSISANFNDPRNKRAAETLDQLAIEAAGMSDAQWEQLKDHYAWTSLAWRNGLNHATRQIGFHNRQRDFESFVTALAHEVSLVSISAEWLPYL